MALLHLLVSLQLCYSYTLYNCMLDLIACDLHVKHVLVYYLPMYNIMMLRSDFSVEYKNVQCCDITSTLSTPQFTDITVNNNTFLWPHYEI